MTGEVLKVVNRTTGPLTVAFDGRSFILVPGENYVDAAIVGHARRQHLIMGTEDPSNPLDFESLIGVPSRGDDCSPAKQSKKLEALDRRLLPDELGRKSKPVNMGRGWSRSLVSNDVLPGEDANFSADV